MTEPTLLYCVGATKAGTSWFYRTLHDHPDCVLPAVKEGHYWDTFDDRVRVKQVSAYQARLEGFRKARAVAEAEGRPWQVANMDRRIADMTGLLEVLTGDRGSDRAYYRWLMQRVGDKKLGADMTPNYAVLAPEVFAQMAEVTPTARFVFMLRDPLARLWSHIRMQAQRQQQEGEEFVEKANNTLWRILNRGQEGHILSRGDYPEIVGRLQKGVPADRLKLVYAEHLYTAEGQREMAEFLGISYHPADGANKAHEGPKAEMRTDLAVKAVRFLEKHYDWAARTLGPLPREWQDNLARV